MKLIRKGNSADGGASYLNHEVLNNPGCDEDQEEERVVEEAAENIVLLGPKLASVDLVEDLHANEGLENDSVVSQLGYDGLIEVDILITESL